MRLRLAATLLVPAVVGSVALAPATDPAGATTRATHFANCTAMHKKYKKYKHGVGRTNAHDHVSGSSKPVTNFYRSNSLYAANTKSDRDHDGIACEAH